MPESRLTVRSAKARELAHRLALRENRSVADIVERALEAYELHQAVREPAASFYARMASQNSTDIDLEAVIREGRKKNTGIDL